MFYTHATIEKERFKINLYVPSGTSPEKAAELALEKLANEFPDKVESLRPFDKLSLHSFFDKLYLHSLESESVLSALIYDGREELDSSGCQCPNSPPPCSWCTAELKVERTLVASPEIAAVPKEAVVLQALIDNANQFALQSMATYLNEAYKSRRTADLEEAISEREAERRQLAESISEIQHTIKALNSN